MIPLMDLFNHRQNASDNFAVSNARQQMDWAPRQLPIRAGDELFDFYGAKDNSELLLGYGFVEHVSNFFFFFVI